MKPGTAVDADATSSLDDLTHSDCESEITTLKKSHKNCCETVVCCERNNEVSLVTPSTSPHAGQSHLEMAGDEKSFVLHSMHSSFDISDVARETTSKASLTPECDLIAQRADSPLNVADCTDFLLDSTLVDDINVLEHIPQKSIESAYEKMGYRITFL